MEPMQKKMLGVGMVAAVLIGAVGVMMFRGGQQATNPTTVAVQGGQQAPEDAAKTNHSPYYQAQLDQYNREKTEQAMRAGQTSVALLNPTEVQTTPFQGAPAQPQSSMQQQGAAAPQYDAARAQAKAQWFKTLMNDEKGGEVVVSRLVVQAPTAGTGEQAGAGANASGKGSQAAAKRLIGGGFTATATFDHEIDTDVPGDMFLTIRGGDFDGAQLHGTIKRVGNYIHAPVNTMYWRGNTYQVTAVAMDPDTGRAVLSGEVDNKWMERFGWPFIVTALSGAASVAAQPPQTAVLGNGGAAVATAEPQTKQILGGAVAAGMTSVAQAMAAEGPVQKAVRRPADAVVVRFLAEVMEK